MKAAVKLRDARQRAKQGRFVIDGARPIARAAKAGARLLEGFICEALLSGQEQQEAATFLSDSAEICSTVSRDVYGKLAFGDSNDGLVAIASMPERTLATLSLPEAPLVAVLEGIEKPGNVGAILRTADAAGVDAVIVADGATDLFNPNTIRASMGTVFACNVCVATAEETIEYLRTEQLPIVATRPDAEPYYYDVDYRRGSAIVLGAEATGLSAKWKSDGVQAVRLPMRGIADSLNVSATAAIMFYEAQRQRLPGE